MVRGRGLASPLRANSDGLATVVALFAPWFALFEPTTGDVGPSRRRSSAGCWFLCARLPSQSPIRVRPPKQVVSRSFDRSR